MSFASSRSLGRAAALSILVGTILSPVVLVATFFIRATSSSAFLVPSIALGILSFAGYILFLISMNGFANFYGAPKIFKNALYGFLTGLVGGFVLLVVVFGVLLYALLPAGHPAIGSSALFSVFALLGVFWLGAFLIALIQSLFYRAAFNALADRCGEDNFRTAGLLMLIGGALMIVFIGGILIFVAWILAAQGFFSMRPPPSDNSLPFTHYPWSPPPAIQKPEPGSN
jgi:uncharacterized membrane protein